jgi:hypothetical protein
MPPKPDKETKMVASNLMMMKHKTVSEKHKAELDKARMPPPASPHRPWKNAVKETMAHDEATLEIKNLRAEMKRLEQRNDDIDKKLKEVESKMPSMKTGGMVKKTAPHMLHKGEMVVPAEVAHHFSKLMKKK